jgi:ComF family protein
LLGLCSDCYADLPWLKQDLCPQCALPSFGRQLCGHCLHSAPDFDATQAIFSYQYPLSALMQRYKYGEMLMLGHTFGEILAQQVHTRPDLIIPMPLHPQRLQQRGFNQSLEIAKIVSKKLHIAVDSQTCVRTKFTVPQVSLPPKRRVRNVKNAFACKRALTGLNIVLLDDVMTTGASLNALAASVKKAGANQVECWVIARTLPH